MSIYHIERGGHADMKRIYPMMEFDFHDWERPTHLECQRALLRGAELLLLKDAQNAECGYAFMLKNNLTGYVLLGWLGVYPHVRGGGGGPLPGLRAGAGGGRLPGGLPADCAGV